MSTEDEELLAEQKMEQALNDLDIEIVKTDSTVTVIEDMDELDDMLVEVENHIDNIANQEEIREGGPDSPVRGVNFFPDGEEPEELEECLPTPPYQSFEIPLETEEDDMSDMVVPKDACDYGLIKDLKFEIAIEVNGLVLTILMLESMIANNLVIGHDVKEFPALIMIKSKDSVQYKESSDLTVVIANGEINLVER